MTFGVLSRISKIGKTTFRFEPRGYNKRAVSTTVPRDSGEKKCDKYVLKSVG
tara:strand:+ start:191 stop:346 length:156 start_codon:yes stop_codon:yes gene_type:complete